MNDGPADAASVTRRWSTRPSVKFSVITLWYFIHEMCELGIEPMFWSNGSSLHQLHYTLGKGL
jgi:hypothetical protein